ncbi:MAG: aldo/keto reductase [Myxococcota bacterium]
MIKRVEFGSTGHASSRVIFGAAALGWIDAARAEPALEQIASAGVNHIDVAASYGDAELRLAPWLAEHRSSVFLATKTGERSATGAGDELRRSLERMQVDHVDLIQMHNLVDESEWTQALRPGGALEALVAARDEGLTRFIGVTGHGTRVAAMHLRSLEEFAFDSVLLPCNHSMLAQSEYAVDFEKLVATCRERGVAVQTIKAVARRRWQENEKGPRHSWYEPLRDPEAVARAVHFVLGRPGLFLNTTMDLSVLPLVLAAASGHVERPSIEAMEADTRQFSVEPLFAPGLAEGI